MAEYKRWAIESIKDALGMWRTVFIAGVRQCGKTTLARQMALENSVMRSLDDTALLNVAKIDPAGFVARRDVRTMIIDEVQKAPMLIPEIKRMADISSEKGQYLLTGSANLASLPTVTESLAGRMGMMRLRTLAEGEICGRAPDFLARAFAGDFPAKVAESESFDKAHILHLAFRGGYPEVLTLSQMQRRRWFKAYLDALLLHDIRELMDVRAYDVLRRLAEMVFARSSKLFAENEITTALGIKHETYVRFMAILKTLYLIEEIPHGAMGTMPPR